jgi:hypothetical protein
MLSAVFAFSSGLSSRTVSPLPSSRSIASFLSDAVMNPRAFLCLALTAL